MRGRGLLWTFLPSLHKESEVIYVTRSYVTRHVADPFVSLHKKTDYLLTYITKCDVFEGGIVCSLTD